MRLWCAGKSLWLYVQKDFSTLLRKTYLNRGWSFDRLCVIESLYRVTADTIAFDSVKCLTYNPHPDRLSPPPAAPHISS